MDEAHIELYTRLLQEHGVSHRSLNWGSRESQLLRFEVLLGVADLRGRTILDVGCGLADLWSYMNEKRLNVVYTGIDMTPAMIAVARARFPDLDVRQGTVGRSVRCTLFDYVVASGIFTYLDGDREARARELIRDMYECARYALAFNMLSNWGGKSDPDEYRADPLHIVSYCRSLSPRIVLRHDYLLHDFTVYLYKSKPESAP